MLRLFKKSEAQVKQTNEKLQRENERLDRVLMEKRKELKYVEAPIAEKLNILQAKEQELMDLIDEVGEKKLQLRKRGELIEFKEQFLKEKENNIIQNL